MLREGGISWRAAADFRQRYEKDKQEPLAAFAALLFVNADGGVASDPMAALASVDINEGFDLARRLSLTPHEEMRTFGWLPESVRSTAWRMLMIAPEVDYSAPPFNGPKGDPWIRTPVRIRVEETTPSSYRDALGARRHFSQSFDNSYDEEPLKAWERFSQDPSVRLGKGTLITVEILGPDRRPLQTLTYSQAFIDETKAPTRDAVRAAFEAFRKRFKITPVETGEEVDPPPPAN